MRFRFKDCTIFVPVFLVFLYQTPSFGQDSLRQDLERLIEQSYQPGSSSLIQASAQARRLFSDILLNEGSRYEYVSISGGVRGYDAVEVIPTDSSLIIGKKIQKWKKLLNELPFIYVPEVLLPKNTSAFFDPKGKFLAFSHDFILNPNTLSSATIHETYHAYTYKQVLDASEDLYAGFYKVTKGHFSSTQNLNYYHRFGSIDEIVATSLSVYIDQKKMFDGTVQISKQEKESLLSEIYHSLEIIKGLSKQLIEVSQRLNNSIDFETRKVILELGEKSKQVAQVTFNLDSYSREVLPAGGGTYLAPHASGLEWIMYFAKDSGPQALKSRIGKLSVAGQEALRLSSEAQKCIYVLIEYPRLDKSDLNCLKQKAPKIFEYLESLKQRTYPLDHFIH